MHTPSLYQFFRRQIQHAFKERGLAEPGTVDYVSGVLTRFAHTPTLYGVRNAEDKPIENIAHMLLEWRRAQGEDDAPRDRSRQVMIMRHIGEYSLFMSGLFRERLQARGQLNYYLDQGRSAYWQSADFETNPNRAKVFRRLYFDLERVSNILDYARRVQFPFNPPTLKQDTPLVALWRM